MDIIQLICAQRALGHSLLQVDLAFPIFFQQIFKIAFRLPDKLGWADPFMRDHPLQHAKPQETGNSTDNQIKFLHQGGNTALL
jgi:hypothetical protein